MFQFYPSDRHEQIIKEDIPLLEDRFDLLKIINKLQTIKSKQQELESKLN